MWGMSHEARRKALFQSWIATHPGILWKITRSFARSRLEVADLNHEMQVQLWHSTSTFAEKAKASTWVYRVCLNTALAWRRSHARRLEETDPAVDVTALASTDASPAEQASDIELVQRLYTAIHQMADFDRALVLLSLDGLSYREIAEIAGITENHVGVGLTRARKQLADLMKGITHELE
jgi:RNA polymerase sigma-70 factor, ECF subfamily